MDVPRNVTGQRWSSPHFRPDITLHGTDWHNNPATRRLLINGYIMQCNFGINFPIRETITCGSEKICTQSRLDYFLLMFPQSYLNLISTINTKQLIKDNNNMATKGKLLKLFGIYILITLCFELYKYIPAP